MDSCCAVHCINECGFYLIPSLEELKDLTDKPEIMDIFLTKVESVSYSIYLYQCSTWTSLVSSRENKGASRETRGVSWDM